MKLKRNLLTILYTVLFLFVMGFGLFQMTNLIVSTVPQRYLVTSIIIFGLIIYLIVAFFIKEADALRFIQTPRALMILLECVVVLVCGGLLFYTQWIGQSMAPAVIYTLLLLSMYAAARLCGGRLCGILCVVVAFYMLSSLSATDLISTQSAIDMLCFLLPFSLFLGILRILIPRLSNNGFVLVVAYLVLGFVFSLALAVNPFVCVLLLGCVLSLFFTAFRQEKAPLQEDTSLQEDKSIWTKGILSAALLVIFTIAFVVCIRFMIPDILGMPNWNLDRNLPLAITPDTLIYVLNKYANPVTYLHLHFSYGILPALLFFFSFLAGYYIIRKKSSYMGPLALSQVALFVYYIAFCEGGSQFYYLYYMLPVFASYGFSNTLLLDEVSSQAESSGETLDHPPVMQEEQPVELPEVQAGGVETEQTGLPEEAQTEILEEAEPLAETEPLTETQTEILLEEAEPLAEVQTEMIEEPETTLAPERPKKAGIKQAAPKDEIPEWTIPAEFLPENQDLQAYVPEEEAGEAEPSEIVLEEDSAPLSDSDDNSIDLDEFVADDSLLVSDEVIVEEPDKLQTADTESVLDIPDELSAENILQAEESDQINTIDNDGANDIEQFISTSAEESDDSVLEFSEPAEPEEGLLEKGEPEELLLEESEPEEILPEESEPEEILPEESEPEETLLINEEEEETQLNNLLERLDMSEPIKRMSESAKEDMADVIEREEEQVELSEALPLKPSKSALPKYKKPNFDFEVEPVNIPLDDQYSTISEYDEVPTVHELENQWKNNSKPVIETVATHVEEKLPEEEPEPVVERKEKPELIHSEQIVRKSGMGKRSYHKITIR